MKGDTMTPSTHRNRSGIAAVALALVLGGGVVLTGCTTTAPTPTPTPTATETEIAPGITDIEDTPGSGEGLQGALSDSQVTTCERDGDAWSVEGTVTNSSAAAASYRIYVSLLAADGSTRALTQVNVDAIEPAAESDWATTIDLAEDDLSCVLRVERYAQ
jgi:hypothetical protein